MRLKINQDKNIIQAAHGKCSFYLPAGTFTLQQSVDMQNWSTIDNACAGNDTVNVGGITPTSFIKITENNGADWEGTAIGVNNLD